MEEERLLYKERNGRGEIVWAMEGGAPVCSPAWTNEMGYSWGLIAFALISLKPENVRLLPTAITIGNRHHLGASEVSVTRSSRSAGLKLFLFPSPEPLI